MSCTSQREQVEPQGEQATAARQLQFKVCLKSASQPAQSLVASLIGILTLSVGATSIFAELQSDLDRIGALAESVLTGALHLDERRLLDPGPSDPLPSGGPNGLGKRANRDGVTRLR